MPSTSEKQRRFMGADLARKRAGKKTRTGMTEQQLREQGIERLFAFEFASKSKGDKRKPRFY